ncbi:MAG: hypothetical protein U0935_23675 [Pirellulales bacterium]
MSRERSVEAGLEHSSARLGNCLVAAHLGRTDAAVAGLLHRGRRRLWELINTVDEEECGHEFGSE